MNPKPLRRDTLERCSEEGDGLTAAFLYGFHRRDDEVAKLEDERDRLKAELDKTNAHMAALFAERARSADALCASELAEAVELLRDNEFSAEDEVDGEQCPECFATRKWGADSPPVHEPDCRLAAFLAKHPEEVKP